MVKFTGKEIDEIAQQLDCGFRCFYHCKTGALLFIPDEIKYPGIEMDAWSEEQEKLERNYDCYIEIDNLSSSDNFRIMADFAEQMRGNGELRDRLINALNKKHPFRNFMFLIDNAGPVRQEWFDFKKASLIKWVKDCLERDMLNVEDKRSD